LTQHLARWGYTASLIDITTNPALLHLKSGIAYLGEGVWVADPSLERELNAQSGVKVRDLISVPPAEAYAANCVRVNQALLVPSGYPQVSAALASRGHRLVHLEMSEFRKVDGGLSCLSLRF
jgi:dimethylargininase